MSEAGEDETSGGGGHHRLAFVLVGLLLAGLVIGLATVGLEGEKAPSVAAGTGCKVHPLAYTVTDDAAEFAEQKAFEATGADVTAPGLYKVPLDLVPALHAASHAYVVVFHEKGLGGAPMAELRALNDRASATKAPVIIAPREQDAGLVAIARGYELSCTDATAQAAAEVTRFAAQTYASVADPAASGSTPPLAPSTPNDAPSPVDPS